MVRECAARSALSRYVWAHRGHAHFWDNAALCAGNGQCERTSVALIEATSSIIRPKLGIRAISWHPDLRRRDWDRGQSFRQGPHPWPAPSSMTKSLIKLASHNMSSCIQIQTAHAFFGARSIGGEGYNTAHTYESFPHAMATF